MAAEGGSDSYCFRRVDRRRAAFAFRRAELCGTRRGDSRSRRASTPICAAVSARLGFSFRMDALDRRASSFGRFDCRRPARDFRLSLSRVCSAALHLPLSIALLARTPFRIRFHLGAATGRRRAPSVHVHQLSRRATRRTGADRAHVPQSWRRSLAIIVFGFAFSPRKRIAFSSTLAECTRASALSRISRCTRRGTLGL